MIDWLTILVALIIISGVVGFFAFLAWKINVSDTLTLDKTLSATTTTATSNERKLQESSKKKRKEQQKKVKTNTKDNEAKEKPKSNEPTDDDEHEESEQEPSIVQAINVEASSKARKRNKNKPDTDSAVVRVPPATHPKSTNKVQAKQQTQPAKPVPNEEPIDDDQPFTVVGGNKNKTNLSTPIQAQTPKETPKQTNGVARLTDTVKSKQEVTSPSKTGVAELLVALDAHTLSFDELDIIMHTIANKKSTIKQETNKKVQIAQLSDESSKVNSDLKKISEELNLEKRRFNELLKEKLDKERQVEVLLSQVQSLSSKQSQDNGLDMGSIQFQVLNEQMKKLSVENANLEKKATRFEVLTEEAKKEKDEIRKTLDKVQKQLEENEDKWKNDEKQHRLEISELSLRLEQLEKENEQLKKEDIVRVESTSNTVGLEEYEKLQEQNKQLEEAQHSSEQQWKQQIELLKKDQETKDENLDHVRSELEKLKKQYENQIREYHQTLTELLPEQVRTDLSHDVQGWLSSYRICFERYSDSLQTLKTENHRLRQDMADVENQLKDIEHTVQNKEELLLSELKSKTALLDGVRDENEQLNEELKRTRSEIERIQTAHDTLLNEVQALKVQLEERFLVTTNTPPVVADESFELIKQPSPSLSPIVVDARAEHFNDFVQPDNEPNEHSDSNSQQHASN